MDTSTTSSQYDTPIGVGGQIDTKTGTITSGTLAGQQAGTQANNYQSTPISQTQDASSINQHLSGTSSGIQFPDAPPPPTKGSGDNTTVPNPIPSAQDIINQGNQQTPGEATNQSLLQKVASLIGNNKSKTTLTNDAEAKAGIPAMTKTYNDMMAQLEGLNNQAADLANQASAGGAIQNQEQQGVQGRGVTAAGLAPQTAGDLRKNQIQQSAIASQSLTLKSAIYAVNGSLTLAKDAADKAALAQYEDQQNQIDYQNALIEANKPQMTKEENNQALLIQTKLADRQTQINQAKDDKKSIIAMASQVMQEHPGDPAAQYAAQQALQESNQQQPDLNKAIGLLGKYQSLDTQIKVQQLIKARNDANANGSGAGDISALPASQQAALKSSGFTNYNKPTQDLAQQLVTGNMSPADLSKRTTGTSPYNSVLTAADAYSMATTGKHFNIAKANIQYAFAKNPQTQNTLNYLGSLIGQNDGSGTPAGGNLDQLIAQSNARNSNFDPNKWGHGFAPSNLPALNDLNQWTKLMTGDPQIAAYYATLTETSDQIAKILQGGGSGAGTSDAKLAQAQALFGKGFTPDQITAVASSLKGLLINRASSMTKDNPYLADFADQFGVSKTGMTGTLEDGTKVTRNADGTITDDKGNKYDSNGKRL